MGYIKDTLKGLSWMGFLRVITRGLTFIRLFILARLLTPLEFGVFGIATLVLALLETITETGINVFFIQNEGSLDDYVDTAWLVSIVRGILISLLLLISAPLIAQFFHSPQSLVLIRLIALTPFLRGLINPSEVKFQKDLHFHKEFLLRVSIFLADAGVSIYLALVTRSAISLVWGMAAGVVVEVLVTFLFIKPTPRFLFHKEKLGKVINRGKWVTASSILQYLFSNGDNLTIGRILNIDSLGFYSMAYKISTIPITEISDTFYKVTFPVFSKIGGDIDRLKKAFFKTSLVITLIVTPVGLIIFFLAEPITYYFLGSTWLPIVPTLRILAIYGIFRAATGVIPAVFLAVKKQEYLTVTMVAAVVGMMGSIIPLVIRFGIVGAAYGASVGLVISLIFSIYYLIKIFNGKK